MKESRLHDSKNFERTWNFFDPTQEYTVTSRHLPHWEQVGVSYFVTFRLKDSLPASVIQLWEDDRNRILSTEDGNRSHLGHGLIGNQEAQLHKQYQLLRAHQRMDLHLDNCHGDCRLRDPELSQIVAQSLLHFDGTRYWISDFVVMPNHVHLICTMFKDWTMKQQCGSWMRFTATAINKHLNKHGAVWQDEPFDHIIRSEDQLHYLRNYIAENPKKAKLKSGEYSLYQFDQKEVRQQM